MYIQRSSRIHAILVDGSNLHYSLKALGFKVDYRRLKSMFSGVVLRAIYFTAMPEKDLQTSIRPMVDFISYNGWVVEEKLMKEWTDNHGETRTKGNMDVEIAIAAMQMAPHVTDMALFSGDGDFRKLVEVVQYMGVKVTVFSSMHMTADILRRQADEFVDLVSIRDKIEMQGDLPTRRRNFLEGT